MLVNGFSGRCQSHLVDRDTVERGNLERQDFSRFDVNKYKALVLASSFKSLREMISPIPQWFDEFMVENYVEEPGTLVVISATDNFPARKLALDLVDARPPEETILSSPGNDYETKEAYVYLSSFKNHELQDPRVRFPEHLSDVTDDPLSPPCDADEVVEAQPQLTLANMGGASHCLDLMYFWLKLVPGFLANTPEDLMERVIKTFPFRKHGGSAKTDTETIDANTINGRRLLTCIS